MREGSASWSKLGLGNAWRLTPSTYGYTPADETLLVTGTFRLPTWRAGRAG